MTNTFEEKLNQHFDIKTETKELVKVAEQLPVTPTLQAELNKVHDSLQKVIDEGKKALVELAEISKETQSAKHYDSLAHMIKSLTDAAKAFVEVDLIVAQTRKVEKETIRQTPGHLEQTNNTNNVYVGTTEQALDMLKNIPPQS